AVNIDMTPPQTFSSVSGNTVTLSASDPLSGVKATFYTVDGGAAQLYTGPFAVSAGSLHSVSYWSVDVADNTESHHTISVDLRLTTTMAVANSSGRKGLKVALTATLTSGGSNLQGKSIVFQVDGAPAGTAATAKNGKASVSYSIPSNFTVGAHTIT